MRHLPEHDDFREAALASIGAESPDPRLEGVARSLERICRALTLRLGLLGVVVRLSAAGDGAGVVVAPPGGATALADLEVTTGEGPAHTATRVRRPVLVTDLQGPAAEDWPGFRHAAADAGVAAVFAFPLHVGAVGFGTFELFSLTAGSLRREDLALIRAFAELATEALLDGDLTAADGSLSPALSRAFDYRAEIAQAQGMVMVELGITLAEAMARLRAHAFTSGEPLSTLARRVVGGYSVPADDD